MDNKQLSVPEVDPAAAGVSKEEEDLELDGIIRAASADCREVKRGLAALKPQIASLSALSEEILQDMEDDRFEDAAAKLPELERQTLAYFSEYGQLWPLMDRIDAAVALCEPTLASP